MAAAGILIIFNSTENYDNSNSSNDGSNDGKNCASTIVMQQQEAHCVMCCHKAISLIIFLTLKACKI